MSVNIFDIISGNGGSGQLAGRWTISNPPSEPGDLVNLHTLTGASGRLEYGTPNFGLNGLFKVSKKLNTWAYDNKPPLFTMTVGDSVADFESNGTTDFGLVDRTRRAGWLTLWPQNTGTSNYSIDDSYWYNALVYLIPSGQTGYFDYNQTSLPANRAYIGWVKEPSGAPSFNLQYSTNSTSHLDANATWTNLGTLNASGAIRTGASATFSFTYNTTTRYRIANVSGGHVRVIAVGAWDNDNGGVVHWRGARGGTDLSAVANTSGSVLAGVMSGIDLDLVVSEYAGEGHNTGHLRTLKSFFEINKTGNDRPDWVVVASHMDSNGGTSHVASWKKWAHDNNAGFVDACSAFKNFSYSSGYFYQQNSDIHLNNDGLEYARSQFWSQLPIEEFFQKKPYKTKLANGLGEIVPHRSITTEIDFNNASIWGFENQIQTFGPTAGLFITRRNTDETVTTENQAGWRFYNDTSDNILRVSWVDTSYGTNPLLLLNYNAGTPQAYPNVDGSLLGLTSNRWAVNATTINANSTITCFALAGSETNGQLTGNWATNTAPTISGHLVNKGYLESILAPPFTATVGTGFTLSVDSGKAVQNFEISITGTPGSITLNGGFNGAQGVVIINKNFTGAGIISLPSISKVINSGSGQLSLPSPSGVHIASFIRNTNTYYWSFGQHFT